ncbi:MAG: zinc metallopeptidase [Clostridia bacterium]|nr:zinc metallopeptidase [Clostridia bacterium]
MFVSLYSPLWYYYLLDISTFVILIPALLFSLIASAAVNRTYSKYQKVSAASGMTGAEVARKILSDAGVTGVSVVPCRGKLTDNFNPKTGVLSLSEGVFSSSSVAAIGIAAHEAGHAIQHAKGYLPLMLRTALYPAVKIGSYLALPLAIVGILIEWLSGIGSFGTVLLAVGIIAYSLSSVFSLITLPVELNASARAKRLTMQTGALTGEEASMASKVLSSAALTYVASLAVSITYLLRFLLILSRLRRRN